jgi:hypothetical protein
MPGGIDEESWKRMSPLAKKINRAAVLLVVVLMAAVVYKLLQ